jgi:hypothetical protein
MSQMWVLVMLAAGSAAGLGAVVLCALQQHEHRMNGLLPGPDPRASTSSLLKAVAGAVPLRRVGHRALSFEDGSGLLISSPDRAALNELVSVAAARDVVLERVDQLSEGLRLVFRGGDHRVTVDVDDLKLVAATT